MERPILPVLLGGLLWACGGTIVPVGPQDAQSDSPSDAGKEASFDSPSACVSPSGYRVCNGPNACPDDQACDCNQKHFTSEPALSYCISTWSQVFACDEGCADGQVCAVTTLFPDSGRVYFCVPEELGHLFETNGGIDRLRYADWSDWTSAPLPTPPACPTVPGVSLCGGACPTCGLGKFCTGRSPLHPYSICIPEKNAYCTKASPGCPVGQSCFLFSVQADAQSLADAAGYCMPTAECKAAQGGYPGGATCLP